MLSSTIVSEVATDGNIVAELGSASMANTLSSPVLVSLYSGSGGMLCPLMIGQVCIKRRMIGDANRKGKNIVQA